MGSPIDARESEWQDSYLRRENFIFYPHEEVVRFVSRLIRKRVGLAEWRDSQPRGGAQRFFDVGCGIGQHIIYFAENGFDVYGIDMTPAAVEFARHWARTQGIDDAERRIRISPAQSIPFEDDAFDVVVARGVLDSMTRDLAQTACREVARVLRPGGYFYTDLIARGRGSALGPGGETVNSPHEFGTVQTYYDWDSARALVGESFEVVEQYKVDYQYLDEHRNHSRLHFFLRPKSPD